MYARAMARCESIKSVLAAVKDAPGFVKHAQNQALCLHNALKDLSLDEDQVADCSSRIAQIGFPADIQTTLLESIVEANKPAKTKGVYCRPTRKNRRLQNYEGFLEFIRAARWKEIQDASGSDVIKMLFAELLCLGLRFPSCPTYGMISTTLSLLQYGETVTMERSKLEKWKATKYVKKLFKSFVGQSRPPPVMVMELPRDLETFQKLYPSLAMPYYKEDKICGHPFDVVMLSTIAHMWPLRKPKSEAEDMDPGNMLSKCMMNFLKFAQSTKEQDDCKIDIYSDRVPVRSALSRKASSRFDIADRAEKEDVRIDADRAEQEDVRIDAMTPDKKSEAIVPVKDTPDKKSEAIVPVKDASADNLFEKAKALLLSLTMPTMPHKDKAVDALVPLKKPSICDPVGKETGFTSASLLKALLDREEQKKKDQAQKRREKEKAQVLKRPAAERLLSNVKKGKHSIPPLGCSKCRYLEHGCTECRNRREKFMLEASLTKK